jgi:hypothetical protein
MLTIPNPPSTTPFRKGNLCTTFSYELIHLAHALGYSLNSATGCLRKPKLPTITHTAFTEPFKKSTQDAITWAAAAAAATRKYLYFLSLDDTFQHF